MSNILPPIQDAEDRYTKSDFEGSQLRSQSRREKRKCDRRRRLIATLTAIALVPTGVFVANKAVHREDRRQEQVTHSHQQLHDSIQQNEAESAVDHSTLDDH